MNENISLSKSSDNVLNENGGNNNFDSDLKMEDIPNVINEFSFKDINMISDTY